MNLSPYINIITGILVFLWVYTALSKLIEFRDFKHALKIQVFPHWIGRILVFLLPLSEIITSILLIIPKTRLVGMYISFFMMILFTLYVGGAVFKIYSKTPCACGGLFARLNWNKHFNLNIILTCIALLGTILMENMN